MLKADVWRDRLLAEEKQLNAQLAQYESLTSPEKSDEIAKEEAETRLAEVHASLADIEAESGPARASQLLSGEYSEPYFVYVTVHEVAYLNVHPNQDLDSARRIWPDQRGPFLEAGECDWLWPVLFS